MLFSEIPGQSEVKERLVSSVKSNNVAHALLFDGKDGGASLPLALAFATYLNCKNPRETDACGECANCSKLSKLAHPDINFTFPTAGGKKVLSENFIKEWRDFIIANPYGSYAEWLNKIEIKQGNIPVEESRKIIQNVSLKPYEGGYKIVLIWFVEAMAAPAANALLKVLEEPPANTLFLLVTADYNRLLATIQSRVQRVSVSELSHEEMLTFLMEKQGLSEERAKQIAFLTEGNIADALAMIHLKENNHKNWFANWMRYCYAFDVAKLVMATEEFDTFSKVEQKDILGYGLKILREIYLENIGLERLIKLEGEELVFVQKFSRVFKFENIGKISDLLSEAIMHIDRNVRAKIVLLDTSISISSLIK